MVDQTNLINVNSGDQQYKIYLRERARVKDTQNNSGKRTSGNTDFCWCHAKNSNISGRNRHFQADKSAIAFNSFEMTFVPDKQGHRPI